VRYSISSARQLWQLNKGQARSQSATHVYKNSVAGALTDAESEGGNQLFPRHFHVGAAGCCRSALQGRIIDVTDRSYPTKKEE